MWPPASQNSGGYRLVLRLYKMCLLGPYFATYFSLNKITCRAYWCRIIACLSLCMLEIEPKGSYMLITPMPLYFTLSLQSRTFKGESFCKSQTLWPTGNLWGPQAPTHTKVMGVGLEIQAFAVPCPSKHYQWSWSNDCLGLFPPHSEPFEEESLIRTKGKTSGNQASLSTSSQTRNTAVGRLLNRK